MGQVAEDMVDGTCCQYCGCFFVDNEDGSLYTHGFPVVCWDCWDDLKKSERKGLQKAETSTF